MRKMAVLIVFLSLFVAAHLNSAAQPKNAVVMGQITEYNPATGSAKIFLQTFDPINGAWISGEAAVSPAGKFETKLPVYGLQEMRLVWGNENVVFHEGPADTVLVVLKALNPAQFKGDHADWNNRMQSFQSDKRNALAMVEPAELLDGGADTAAVLNDLAKRKDQELKWVDKYLRKTKAPADFSKWAMGDHQFRFAEEERALKLGSRQDLPWKTIRNWVNDHHLTDVVENSAAYLEHSFKLLGNLYGSVTSQLKAAGETQESAFITATLDTISHVYSGFLRESQLSNVYMGLVRQLSPNEVPWLKDHWNAYLKEYGSRPMASEVARIAELRKRTDPSFDEVMAKHRGKVVLIDCWATWCGPCRVQLPFMHTLKDSLAGEDVDFVYFSFDREQQKWQDFLQKEQLVGEHYLLSGGRLANEVNSRFQVSGIPRYILIDKEGKVANANAPRPGTISPDRQWVFNPVLLAEIRKLLAQ